jgi:hypothetical protein
MDRTHTMLPADAEPSARSLLRLETILSKMMMTSEPAVASATDPDKKAAESGHRLQDGDSSLPSAPGPMAAVQFGDSFQHRLGPIGAASLRL